MKVKSAVYLRVLLAGLFFLFVPGSICIAQPQQETPPQEKPSQDKPAGILMIDGGNIKNLQIRTADGSIKPFEQPAESITLPIGKYQVSYVRLADGYYIFGNPRDFSRFEITTGTVTVIKLGAPLRQVLSVNRLGRTLNIEYKLQGNGGELYNPENRGKPPVINIYKGDQLLESANFGFS